MDGFWELPPSLLRLRVFFFSPPIFLGVFWGGGGPFFRLPIRIFRLGPSNEFNLRLSIP